MNTGKVAAFEDMYDGSRSFLFIAEATKIPLDQVSNEADAQWVPSGGMQALRALLLVEFRVN